MKSIFLDTRNINIYTAEKTNTAMQIAQIQLMNQMVQPRKVWLSFLFFGWSYGAMNKMGKQIAFYLTLGGLGLWTIYVLFTLSGKIRRYNEDLQRQIDLLEGK